jgi:pyruvate dehydrogenase E2 component (dihydrolipoyllysine-residue acetyltransferase)
MAISVVMPALELTQESGKLVAWRKKEGERVVKGEVLLEVETDKAVVEIEASADGILAGIEAAEGAVVPVGRTIAWIVQVGEAVPSRESQVSASARQSIEAARSSVVAAGSAESVGESGFSSSAAKISPKARRLAKESGVDISRVHGSGAGGEILAADILAAAATSASTPAMPSPALRSASASVSTPVAAATNVEPLSTIGRLMAERTLQSWTSIPHFFLVREVDAEALNAVREKHGAAIEKAGGVRLSHTDLLVALVAGALKKYPRMNASWTPQGIRLNTDINVSVAIAVKDGVTSAVIAKANHITLAEISVQRRDLAERARAGRSRPSDIAGGTFTISNLGMFGVDAFTAIISPPQAAILACGRITERVVAANGQAVVRPMMTLTLSSDHRVVDGAQAAAFLSDLAEAIREPEKCLRL